MTKKELKKLMEEYISRQDNYTKEEWYGTPYELVGEVLQEFASELGIELGD